jgi:hypothetical protein
MAVVQMKAAALQIVRSAERESVLIPAHDGTR